MGKEIIQSGVTKEYRLAVTPKGIVIDGSFRELPAPRLIAVRMKKEIQRFCHEVKSASVRRNREHTGWQAKP